MACNACMQATLHQAAACGALLGLATALPAIAQQLQRNQDLTPLLLGMLAPREGVQAPPTGGVRQASFPPRASEEEEHQALLRAQAAGAGGIAGAHSSASASLPHAKSKDVLGLQARR